MDRKIYSQIYKSAASTKGDWFKDGEGLLVVVEVIAKEGNDGPTIIPVFKVLESRSKGDRNPLTGVPVEPNPPGAKVSYPQKLTKFKSALGNIKGFVCALLGVTEDALTEKDFEDTMEGLVGKDQDGRGRLLRYSTYQQASDKQKQEGKGDKNTYPSFSHVVEGNSDAEIAKRRAELDKTNPVSL